MAEIPAALRDAFTQGADEIVIRVSRYGADLKTPEAFQALIRFQDRRLPWKVGVRAGPVLALEAALSEMTTAAPTTPPAAASEEDIFG